jgi:hypothetical protein
LTSIVIVAAALITTAQINRASFRSSDASRASAAASFQSILASRLRHWRVLPLPRAPYLGARNAS